MKKAKRLISFLLAFCLAFGILSLPASLVLAAASDPQIPTENTFYDVSADDWFHDSVYAAASIGIIAGNADGSFNPNGILSWIQTVVLTVRLAQYNSGENIYGAADQTGSHWYDVYVDYAIQHGIITTVSSEPDAAITRGEAAALFVAVLGDSEEINTVGYIITGINHNKCSSVNGRFVICL